MSAIKIDAFGHIVAESQNGIAVKGGDGLLDQYHVELDKTTGNTKPVKGDPISIPELVASYEDQCGMEWARRQLRAGVVPSDYFRDDGKHGGDYSGSTELNVAFRDAKAAKAQGDQVAKSLGIQSYMSVEDVDDLVKQRVAEIMEAQKASANDGGSTK